jgi:hypothetical protein
MFLAGNVSAATFCVGTATEFRNALLTASTNGQADDIRLRSGTYLATPAARFEMILSEAHGVRISGGWTNTGFIPCTSTTGSATQTILDGSNSTFALRVVLFGAFDNVPIAVEGLTVRNGYAFNALNSGYASGLSIAGTADGGAVVTVDRIIAEYNVSNSVTPAVSLTSDLHAIRLTNAIVRYNQTEIASPVVIHTNCGASAIQNLSALFNSRSSPNGGAVDWTGSTPAGHMTASLLWGNTGGQGDLVPNPKIRYDNNRYGTGTALFGSSSTGNLAITSVQLDSLHRPTLASPLRDKSRGVGAKDVYGNPRRYNGSADIGAAEGLAF